MPTELETRDRARALLAAWNDHDTERATSFYATDVAMYDVGDSVPQIGHEGFRRMFGGLLRAFPDAHFNEDQLIVEADQVALFWTLEGTHRGRLLNIPPTGRAVRVRGASYIRFTGEKISRIDRIWDVAGVLRTIGLLPEL